MSNDFVKLLRDVGASEVEYTYGEKENEVLSFSINGGHFMIESISYSNGYAGLVFSSAKESDLASIKLASDT